MLCTFFLFFGVWKLPFLLLLLPFSAGGLSNDAVVQSLGPEKKIKKSAHGATVVISNLLHVSLITYKILILELVIIVTYCYHIFIMSP